MKKINHTMKLTIGNPQSSIMASGKP